MKKSIYALIFLLIAVCSLNCSNVCFAEEDYQQTNAFRIIRQVTNSGQSMLTYSFPLNSKEMKSFGVSEQNVTLYKFYLTIYVNTLAQNSKKQDVEGVSVSSVTYFEEYDSIGYSIIFDSLQAQNKYFGNNGEQSSNAPSKSKGFFIKTTTIKTAFPVSSQKVAGDLKMVCLMALSSWSDASKVSSETKEKIQNLLNESLYIYDFATQQKALQSQVMYQDEIFYHNVFVKTYEDLASDNSIVFWVKSINKPVWYLSALFAVLIGMLIAFLVLKFKNHKFLA